MGNNIFKGHKIRLRAKTTADLENDRQRIEDPDYDTETDRLCDQIYLPNSADSLQGEWEREIKRTNTWDNCNLVIETMEGISVGGISITHVDRKNGVFSYGLGISREHQRNGYASEAIKLLLNYYFNELRFHKCNIVTFDFNQASMALHESLGFVQEGKQRESKYTDGVYHDIIYYGITKKEFNDKHKQSSQNS